MGNSLWRKNALPTQCFAVKRDGLNELEDTETPQAAETCITFSWSGKVPERGKNPLYKKKKKGCALGFGNRCEGLWFYFLVCVYISVHVAGICVANF